MRVVIATTTGFHLRRLAVELDAAGASVHYFSYAPSFRQRREGLPRRMATSLFWPLLPGSAAAQYRPLPALQRRAAEAGLASTDDYLAERLPPCDIFIGLSSMAVRSAEAARRQGATVIIDRGARHVLSQHELLTRDGGRGLSESYIKRELASYAAADYIALPSNHATESFIERGFSSERLFTNPLGVDMDVFRPTPRPKNGVHLLFVGGWSYQKGVDILVDVLQQRPDWRLTHVGMQAGTPFPSTNQFTSLGYQDHSALARVMSDHHILVLPSRQDGFGMVLLEGLASGLPIVASDMTGAPDIQNIIENKSCVGLARAGDAATLLEALDRMVSFEAGSPPDRRRLTPRDLVALSWKGYGDRYLNFLMDITATRHGSTGATPKRTNEAP